jgi:catechol 2,3-dioxygenase-like lactoylglutathione lyase family enzyme
MKLHHFAIKVKNIDISIKFYVEKLGFLIKTPKATTEDGKYSYLNLDLGGAELELIEDHDKTPEKEKVDLSKPPMCPHIALQSDDFEMGLQLLKTNGVKIFDGPHVTPNDVKMLTILDPDGYRIDIGQLLK